MTDVGLVLPRKTGSVPTTQTRRHDAKHRRTQFELIDGSWCRVGRDESALVGPAERDPWR